MLSNLITNYLTLIIAFFVIVLLHFILKFILQKITHLALKSTTKLDDYLVASFVAPLKLFLWIIFIYFILKEFNLANFFIYVNILIAINFMWLLMRVIGVIEKYFIDNSAKFDNDIVRLMAKLVKLSVIVIIGLSIMQFFGFTISSVLTFGGVGGIVIGFAAKDMLGNIFGGLMISLDKPFSVGDWVRIGNVEGMVEHIGWRMTIVRTFSKNPVYVPNGMFMTKSIETPSRMTNRRIKEIIGVRYDDIKQLPLIVDGIEIMLKAHKGIDKNQSLRVYFNYFNASSLDINVYAFTNTISKDKYQKVKADILFKIADIIAQHKAEIAFPTQTIHLEK